MRRTELMAAKKLLKYRHWRCEIKEVGNEKPIVSELHGVYDEDDCVKHWGLKNADVEWYKLTEIEED